jgi:lipid II:glycine glycyltransferase (peptidoglycan interpeptide bridge formation enzyme)
LIDTTKSLDALWQGLEKKSSRWGVKTAQKNNLILFETQNKEDISNFYKIYLETAEKGKFKPEGLLQFPADD